MDSYDGQVTMKVGSVALVGHFQRPSINCHCCDAGMTVFTRRYRETHGTHGTHSHQMGAVSILGPIQIGMVHRHCTRVMFGQLQNFVGVRDVRT